MRVLYSIADRLDDMIRSTRARNSDTKATTINTAKNACLTCGFVGKITFDNSALEFLIYELILLIMFP